MEDQQGDEPLNDQRSSRDAGAPSPEDHQLGGHADAKRSSNDDRSNPAGDDQLDGAVDDLDAGLTPRQQRAILALVTEPTIAKAAEHAQVPERTLHRWLKQDAFARAYREARRETFGQAIALAQRYTPLAVNALAKIMSDLATAASARVSAACAILKFGRESIELDELQARIESLERATSKQPEWRNR